jgi:hypothetical protein
VRALDFDVGRIRQELLKRRAVRSIGRMLSAVPCRIRAGTSMCGMSTRKSVGQVSGVAAIAVVPAQVRNLHICVERVLRHPRAEILVEVVESVEEPGDEVVAVEVVAVLARVSGEAVEELLGPAPPGWSYVTSRYGCSDAMKAAFATRELP